MVVNPTIQAIYCIEIEPLLIVQEVGGGALAQPGLLVKTSPHRGSNPGSPSHS